METKFQTSFIPKVPIGQSTFTPVKRPMNFFVFISTIIFILSLVLAGASYGYIKVLERSQEKIKTDLDANIKAFDPVMIEKYVRLDTRIETAKNLLLKHISASNLFSFLSENTLKTVRFNDFKYSLGSNGVPSLAINGIAKNYNSVAYQAQVFGGKKELKNFLISGLNADVERDTVSFNVSTDVEPSFTYYSNSFRKQQNTLESKMTEELPVGNNTTSTSTNTEALPKAVTGAPIPTPNNTAPRVVPPRGSTVRPPTNPLQR